MLPHGPQFSPVLERIVNRASQRMQLWTRGELIHVQMEKGGGVAEMGSSTQVHDPRVAMAVAWELLGVQLWMVV